MVNIHGKEYITVAERLAKAKEDIVSISTEVLYTEPRVVVKATITLKSAKIFTGISAANSNKSIEEQSPYEVAETSAVGRALAFAGYETTNGIASAEEMKKAELTSEPVECTHETFKIVQVQKEGPNKGKYFKSCENCKKFLGWSEKKANEEDWYGEIH